MNVDLYNHGTLGVASDKRSASEMLGHLEGWDPLLTTEAKYGLFLRFDTLKTLPSATEQ